MINDITFWIWFAIWPVWFVWEMVLLILRTHETPKPKLISMVARDMGWKFNSAVYSWCGLAAHFWWPGKDWAPVATGVTFWVIVLLLLIEDIYLYFKMPDQTTWPRWLRWQRMPLAWMAIGILAGHFLFRQADASYDALWSGR